MEALARLKSLSRLRIGRPDPSELGLEKIGGLPNLAYLGIMQTGLSDTEIGHLQKLKRLKVLCLQKTQITETGLASLRAALLNCDIHTDEGAWTETFKNMKSLDHPSEATAPSADDPNRRAAEWAAPEGKRD